MHNTTFVCRTMPNNSQYILGLSGPTAAIINAFKEAIDATSGSPSWVTGQVLKVEFGVSSCKCIISMLPENASRDVPETSPAGLS